MGRRYTLEGQQSFMSLLSFISAKTGAKPVVSAASFREALNNTSLPCSIEVSPVTTAQFGQASRNWWLAMSAIVVVSLGAHHAQKRRRRQRALAV
ncbi:hypothetical protein WJX75_007529 [Coccomyxa subellipsoidea]|uniref:Uncharacterized protein n=1 Tax=Coccomyxa subellipsoidea TaxID=248742 RepID=A0ABR2YNE5_9CHLO